MYLEHIVILLIAPFCVGFFFAKGETRRFMIFFLCGVMACLLSAYLNSFLTYIYDLTAIQASIKITPIVEEIIKSLPLLFYIIIFLPAKNTIFQSAISIGIGFATFENYYYILSKEAPDLAFIFIRGFGVSTMHIVCAAMLGFSLSFFSPKEKFPFLFLFASMSICISYHAIYNLLISGGNTWALSGYFLPIFSVLLLLVLKHFIPRIIQ